MQSTAQALCKATAKPLQGHCKATATAINPAKHAHPITIPCDHKFCGTQPDPRLAFELRQKIPAPQVTSCWSHKYLFAGCAADHVATMSLTTSVLPEQLQFLSSFLSCVVNGCTPDLPSTTSQDELDCTHRCLPVTLCVCFFTRSLHLFCRLTNSYCSTCVHCPKCWLVHLMLPGPGCLTVVHERSQAHKLQVAVPGLHVAVRGRCSKKMYATAASAYLSCSAVLLLPLLELRICLRICHEGGGGVGGGGGGVGGGGCTNHGTGILER